jgi:light-regulated signal transduction histidine kinase (bacteriophytochrome)
VESAAESDMGNADQSSTADEVELLRRALDEETRERLEVQRKLDEANGEFEEFISMAAHDLRESLRYVASFSQLMAETYADRVDSDGALLLSRIQEEAARSQSLLAGAVDYWAVCTAQRESTRTDMEAVLRQALLSADSQITEQSASVTHDPLPAVMGDFEILGKVLHHLIRNAIEYSGTSSPRVHISSKRLDDDWAFSVEDNGPGIAPELQSRIFRAFARLHGREHPGNGLGLAFCKKAIEWYGGRMWLESTPGAGSTFCFTLPAAD